MAFPPCEQQVHRLFIEATLHSESLSKPLYPTVLKCSSSIQWIYEFQQPKLSADFEIPCIQQEWILTFGRIGIRTMSVIIIHVGEGNKQRFV
jgi:hypothetical protein